MKSQAEVLEDNILQSHTNESKLVSSDGSISQIISDYISLTKPGIMVLLLITTICPMLLASHGSVSIVDLLLACLGGALVSGSASAMNCIWDRDIDQLMERTKNRPMPTGRIKPIPALIFSLFLLAAGLGVLWKAFPPLAAGFALAGHLFYVFIYTMWLKRTTKQNIVIGGAAGAFPPLVGWAAVTGEVSITSFLLFLVVFLWTPAHFWALAINKNQDYRRANVPMLPVVCGERRTSFEMMLYAASLIPTTYLLLLNEKSLGMVSYILLPILAGIFFAKTVLLWREKEIKSPEGEKRAWDVFGFSLIYLALFFMVLVVDGAIL